MSVHIEAKKGEIAETVLMPGDPLRAKWAAERFLIDARLVTDVRGMLGFTGTHKGRAVTIMGSGMGMPSMSIYANELINSYGARRLIRMASEDIGLADPRALRMALRKLLRPMGDLERLAGRAGAAATVTGAGAGAAAGAGGGTTGAGAADSTTGGAV